MTIRPSDVEPTPDVFAAVMATGILSIAAHNHRYSWISDTLGVIATIGLVLLVALVVAAAVGRRRTLRWDLTDPDVTLRLFTFVAACAVIDTRLSSNVWVLRVLGAVGLCSWLVLIGVSARNMLARRWAALRDHAHGAWELASVGTSGLAIVIARAAFHTGHRWWLAVAVVVWVAAILIYGLMTWLILWRVVNERQDRDGFEPDTWILMGGMAIATLAGDNIHVLAPAWLAGPVRMVTVVTWVTATLWIPPLIYFGLHRISRRPSMLRFSGVWWAFIFPLGMYSAASYAMAAEIGQRSLLTVSLVFFWDALAAWLVVVVAGLLLVGRALLQPANRDAGRP
ncbi:tellurite resistance/C4-dicarboxylate transporter family protein [Mycobacterium nebraskense]|uniref:C4-dicarboxylate ABC transporter n=1 Tax=Mycobacterium nebraskense TaxID=244292 RepID=A0A1X1YXC9_9MYCO|nr:tellurite resistance/C4-dicarboxylate transporter family protein [Mycobacterium nebraskense]KLO46320.1 C4-dicarboxylate ABC transporter [Mycobacterium nebraskense]MBI2697072.1 tellurite resistance/C4-dicarboxylate transporter family protein [Mycobacterium nebraskense]MCV7117314.1 tellurite resistance/C4-dicarboxylate transporter family protein [Mycobacterium nebraskense]ORW15759.1 C4-dicarboxylate ABC transporter [Mycobacterium nebraskense]